MITAPTPDPSASFEPAAIEWSMDAFGEGVDEGHLDVPIDYANPDAGTFTLYLARHRATGDARRLAAGQPRRARRRRQRLRHATPTRSTSSRCSTRFDIIGWDPRGTGLSTPAIDCIDDYDHYFTGTDITPDDEAERHADRRPRRGVRRRSASRRTRDILQFVGTNNSARDMDSIRKALGEDEISYFGFSYGSELGATWATLFPDTVRAAVLDGAVDPNADRLQRDVEQDDGFEDALTTFLAQCSADPACAFHNDGDAEGAFDELMLKLDEKPMPTAPDRPDTHPGDGACGRRQGDVQRRRSGRRWPRRSPRPSRATAAGCSRSTTSTTGARATARGATSSRRSR